MKVLVTGAAGFVASNLIKKIKLDYPEWEILGIDNYFTGKEENHIEGVRYKILSTWEIIKNFETKNYNPDIVFHFGEYSRIVKSFDDIDYVLKSNLTGTTEVLEYCRINNAKIVYSATSSSFGNKGEDQNLNPYSWCKTKIVELIKNYHDWYNIKYEICYFFNVYGPNQIESGDYATVVGIFERQWRNREPLTVVSPGTQMRDFTHVEDIVEAVVKATLSNLNGEWHLRSGKNVTILDLAKMFTDNWKLIPERRGERFTADLIETDTQEKLKWKPKWYLEQWIKLIKDNVKV